MTQRILLTLTLMTLFVLPTTARDLLRICAAHYPGGCSLYIYDYSGAIYDYHALWCGGDLIYEDPGYGGRIGSNGNCVYFV